MNPSSSANDVPLGRRLLRLALAVSIVLLFVFVFAPFVIRHFPPMREFAQAVKEKDQNPGALYYTDVPDSTAAELHTRSTVRFFGNKNASR